MIGFFLKRMIRPNPALSAGSIVAEGHCDRPILRKTRLNCEPSDASGARTSKATSRVTPRFFPSLARMLDREFPPGKFFARGRAREADAPNPNLNARTAWFWRKLWICSGIQEITLPNPCRTCAGECPISQCPVKSIGRCVLENRAPKTSHHHRRGAPPDATSHGQGKHNVRVKRILKDSLTLHRALAFAFRDLAEA